MWPQTLSCSRGVQPGLVGQGAIPSDRFCFAFFQTSLKSHVKKTGGLFSRGDFLFSFSALSPASPRGHCPRCLAIGDPCRAPGGINGDAEPVQQGAGQVALGQQGAGQVALGAGGALGPSVLRHAEPRPGRRASPWGRAASGFGSRASARFFLTRKGRPCSTRFAVLFSGVAAPTVTFQGQESRSPPSPAAVCPRGLTREAPCRVPPTSPGIDRLHDAGTVTLGRARGQRSRRCRVRRAPRVPASMSLLLA